MDRKLVKSDDVRIEGRTYPVRYYEGRTAHGTRRFSAEIALGEADCIIFDADSLPNLEAKVVRLGPASVLSRTLAGRVRRSKPAGRAGEGDDTTDDGTGRGR